jgi:Ras family protein T1
LLTSFSSIKSWFFQLLINEGSNKSCIQVKCYNVPIQPSDIVNIKRVVLEESTKGVDERGLTMTGFLFLHAIFIKKGHPEASWNVLRKFGYDDDVKLAEDLIPTAFKRAPDQVIYHRGKLRLL